MPTSIQIDAHHHFWQISRGDYDWMTDEVADIRHDILPQDLAPHLAKHGITGTVVVQAAASVAETEFLLGLAETCDFIRGVVGWVDLEATDAPHVFDRLQTSPKLKGLRLTLQDIEKTDWILSPAVGVNLAAMATRGLRLDALIQPRHLQVMAQVARALPDLQIVVDHCAKPVISGGADAGDLWRSGMAQLAEQPNVWCKISGLANEAGPEWSAAPLQPVVDHVVRHFGADRLMWGSDWPVLNLVGDYAAWRGVSAQLFEGRSPSERDAIFGGTACKFYQLEAGQ